MSLCDTLITLGQGPNIAVLLHAAGSSPKALEKLGAALAPHVGRVAIPSFTRNGASLIGHSDDAEPMRAPVALDTALLEAPAGPARSSWATRWAGCSRCWRSRQAHVSTPLCFTSRLSCRSWISRTSRIARRMHSMPPSSRTCGLLSPAAIRKRCRALHRGLWRVPLGPPAAARSRGSHCARAATARRSARYQWHELDPKRIAQIDVPVLVMHGTPLAERRDPHGAATRRIDSRTRMCRPSTARPPRTSQRSGAGGLAASRHSCRDKGQGCGPGSASFLRSATGLMRMAVRRLRFLAQDLEAISRRT